MYESHFFDRKWLTFTSRYHTIYLNDNNAQGGLYAKGKNTAFSSNYSNSTCGTAMAESWVSSNGDGYNTMYVWAKITSVIQTTKR